MKRWIGILVVVLLVVLAGEFAENWRSLPYVRAQSTTVGFAGGGLGIQGGVLSGNGSGFTNLNATNISSGTVADARLSGNVPLLNATNVFTGNNSFSGTVGANTVDWQCDVTGFCTMATLSVTKNLAGSVGIQTATVVGGCTFAAGAIGNSCTNTIILPVAESDTSYVITGCSVVSPSTGHTTTGGPNTLTTTTFKVDSVALDAVSTGGGTVECMVVHP